MIPTARFDIPQSVSAPSDRNLFISIARGMFFAGCLALPMGAIRLGPFTVSDILFLCVALVAFLGSRQGKLRPLPQVQWAAWLLSLGVALSTFQSVDAANALLVGARVLFLWTLWLWSARLLLTTPQHLYVAIEMFCLGAGVSALAAMGQAGLGVEIPGVPVIHGRAPGLQFHPNGQGGLLTAAFALAFALLMYRRKTVLLGGLLLSYVAGLVIAGSVSGMLGAAFGGVVVLLRKRVSPWGIVMVIPMFGAVWWLSSNVQGWFPSAPDPVERFLDTTGQGEGESTLGSRIESIRFALSALEGNPFFGYGLDSASLVEYREGTETHNFFLFTWIQGGLLTLVAVLVMIGTALLSVRKIRGYWDSALQNAVFSAMLALLLFSMSGPVLYERWFWFPFILAIAMRSASS